MAAVLSMMAVTACQPRGPEKDSVVRAVQQNKTEELAAYLEAGGDANFKSRDGDPLLYIASGPRGGVEVMVILLAAGVDPDTRSRTGRTALQNAASWCDTDMVALLIAGGADVNLAGKDGKTPAQSLCIQPEDRRTEVLGLLHAAGATGN